MELKEKLDRLVVWDLRDLEGRKDIKVITGWTASLELGVVTDLQAPEVNQGSKVTEVILVMLDPKVHQGFLDFLGHQVSWVSVVRQGRPASKATEEFQEVLDLKVNLVMEVSEVPKVTLVQLVHLDQLERKEPKGQLAILVPTVPKGLEVTRDLQVHLDSEAPLDLLEILVSQEHLGSKDLLEYQGIRDNLDLKVKLDKQEGSSMQLDSLLSASQDHQDLLVLQGLPDLQGCQARLVLLVCLVILARKVTGDILETIVHQSERLKVSAQARPRGNLALWDLPW